MSTKRILALIGSPRKESTSEFLARHLTDGLTARGWQADIQRIAPALHSPERWATLEQLYCDADVVLLATPLYVDSLPAETTLALERLVALPSSHPRRMLAILNSGFIEAEQNDTALNICRLFARDADLEWIGGLALGGGGAIGGMANGRKLKDAGGMTEHIVRALDFTVEAIDTYQPIPARADALIRRPLFPGWLYKALADFSMLKAAWDHHVLLKINAQPYKQ